MADNDSSEKTDLDDAHAILRRIPALRCRCDLDLLVFFARHWRALLSSEQLARLLGYPLNEIARSRDGLVAAGLLIRVQDPTRAERLYVFEPEAVNGGSVSTVLRLASTPRGRFSLRQALTAAPSAGRNAAAEHPRNDDGRHDALLPPRPRGGGPQNEIDPRALGRAALRGRSDGRA